MNKTLQLALCFLLLGAAQAKPGFLNAGAYAGHGAGHLTAYNAAAAANAVAVANAAAAAHGAYGAHSAYGPRYVGPPAPPPVLVNGVPADTPEVAHAKASHFAAYNAAAAAAAAAPDHGAVALAAGPAALAAHGAYAAGAYGAYAAGAHGAYGPRYVGPLAPPPVLVNGVPADTPEVAHAKASHFAAYNAVAAHSGAGVYHGGAVAPYGYAAAAPVLVNGVLGDTAAVHAAKAAHFAAHAAAKGLLHH